MRRAGSDLRQSASISSASFNSFALIERARRDDIPASTARGGFHAFDFPFALRIAGSGDDRSVAAASAQAGNKVGVTVTGLRSSDGVVRCGLYASADGFRQPGREMRGAVGADPRPERDLHVRQSSGRHLCGRGLPCRAQRSAHRDRRVRQAEAGLRLLRQSLVRLRAALVLRRGLRVHAAASSRFR